MVQFANKLFISWIVSFFALLMLLFPYAVWSRVYGETEMITLPAPQKDGAVSVEAALNKRRSVRFFKDTPLALQSVSQLLWAAQGITDKRGFRTAPSAGALYPLELYLFAGKADGLEPGIYHYRPSDHSLLFITEGDFRETLCRAALRQDAICQAPAVFLIAGVPGKTTGKYGERGIRYVHLEAGHVAQNILLQAVSLDLGGVAIGAFSDHEVNNLLKMDKGRAPLYIVPVGMAK
jgi:SagB-type dehydrogenase family enzyme